MIRLDTVYPEWEASPSPWWDGDAVRKAWAAAGVLAHWFVADLLAVLVNLAALAIMPIAWPLSLWLQHRERKRNGETE